MFGSRVEKSLNSFFILPQRIASSGRSSLAFFVCALAMVLIYRIHLTWALFTRSIRPFDFDPSAHSIWFMVRYLPYDLALLFTCFFLSWVISHVSIPVKNRQIRIFFTILGLIFLHLFLISLLLIHGGHTRLLFEAQTGLSYFVILELFLNVPFIELIKFVDWKDGLFLLMPIGLFWGVLLLPLVFRVRILKVSIGLLVLISSFSIIGSWFQKPRSSSRDPSESGLFLLSDIVEQGIFKISPEDGYIKIVKEGELGIQPGGMDYRDRVKPLKLLPPQKDHPWNIVFFIMESVGSRYIFDTDRGHPMPMPFLHGLAKESLHLKNHYTSSNITTKAVFSLLSGLYDFFHQETFGIRPDASVPSLHNFLSKEHESFLVTPSPIQWYFPTAFVKNSGLTEMHHFENLNLKTREEQHSFGRYIGRDEVQTIDFFNRRIRQAKEPFLGHLSQFYRSSPLF